MTMSAITRLENHKMALALLLQELGDHAIDIELFQPTITVFAAIPPTTWESLERDGYLCSATSLGYPNG